MNFPQINGWVPFKGLQQEVKEKLKNSENENNDDDGKVEIPSNWKPEPFKIEDNPHRRLYALTEFRVPFPNVLHKYIETIFPILQKALQEHFIKAELNLIDGEMLVKTTPKTFDPFMIIKAHGVIKVLARYVPVEESLTILSDDLFEDIIPIGHQKKDVSLRRRARLESDEIKQLFQEIIGCKIFVSGKTVVVIGPYSSLNRARKVVTDCFHENVHPIYNLKRFQIMNKLALRPELAGKDWSEFLPKIQKKNVPRKAPVKIREKKEYTPFPAPQPDSKIDKELETGVFHLKYERKNKRLVSKDKSKKNADDKEAVPAKKRKFE